MRKTLIFMIFSSFLLACQANSSSSHHPHLQQVLGQAAIAILQQPEQVQALTMAAAKDKSRLLLAGYPVASQSLLSDARQIEQLQSILLNDSHYQFTNKKRCAFVPQTGFRFIQQEQSVDVIVDRSCGLIEIHTDSQRLRADRDPAKSQWQQFLNQLS